MMTTIKTGRMIDQSQARVRIHSDGDSKTEVSLGSMSKDASLDLVIFDKAHGFEPGELGSQLDSLETSLQRGSAGEREAERHVKEAKDALKKGKHEEVAGALRAAGTIALSMAKSIGTALAETAIEHSLGLAGKS